MESRETLLKTKTWALEVSELAEVKAQVSVWEIANKSREKRAESTVQNNSERPKDRGGAQTRRGLTVTQRTDKETRVIHCFIHKEGRQDREEANQWGESKPLR